MESRGLSQNREPQERHGGGRLPPERLDYSRLDGAHGAQQRQGYKFTAGQGRDWRSTAQWRSESHPLTGNQVTGLEDLTR